MIATWTSFIVWIGSLLGPVKQSDGPAGSACHCLPSGQAEHTPVGPEGVHLPMAVRSHSYAIAGFAVPDRELATYIRDARARAKEQPYHVPDIDLMSKPGVGCDRFMAAARIVSEGYR